MTKTTSHEGFEQAILDSIPVSTAILDCSGVIRFTNKAWRNFTVENGGDPSKSGVGMNYLALCDAASDENAGDAKLVATGIRAALEGSKEEFLINYPCNSPSQVRWFGGRITRIEHNEKVWISITHEDLSAQKRMEEHLAIALYDAKAASIAKSSFLSTMSHEIRTPLSAISGMAKLIGREPLSTNQYENLRKLEIAIKHLNSTINDILDLAKIEAGRLVLEQIPLNIDLIFEDIAGMVQSNLDIKGLKLKITVDTIPAGLLGDPTRIIQAILNYIGNAIKFTSQGEIRLCASVAEESPTSALLRFDVHDTGIGIYPEKIPTIFEKFVQADSATNRMYGGSGLGLSIAKKLVQAMGGEVGVNSEVGKGSTFWFTVRLKKQAESAAESQTDKNDDAASILIRNFTGKRVLLAEDDEFNREIGCILLRDVGMVVDEAENGRVALEMALRHTYDLILMDMQMPEIDGLDATRKIRTSHIGSSVPIIALTANAFHEDKVRCIEAGMNDFITKPLDPLLLYQVMRDIFDDA